MSHPENRERILQAYMDHLREHGNAPESVFKFCKALEIDERSFFSEFSSFETVENTFWQRSVGRVIDSVSSGEEWAGFSARQRMLSFLFAFFEDALGMRSLMLLRFSKIQPLSKPHWLKGFEGRFSEFAKSLIEHGIDNNEIAERGRLSALYPDALYLLLRGAIDYNLKDDSEGYERTDAFIEKSVNLTFDLLRTQAIDSAFDLARFLLPKSSPASKSE